MRSKSIEKIFLKMRSVQIKLHPAWMDGLNERIVANSSYPIIIRPPRQPNLLPAAGCFPHISGQL